MTNDIDNNKSAGLTVGTLVVMLSILAFGPIVLRFLLFYR